jgi:leader peptidase (prepilin peptidase)/N-methyltransferase
MTPPAAPRLSARQIALWLGPRDRLAVLACAILAFGVAALRQDWLAALPFAPLGAAAAAIFLIDLRHYRIPDRLSLPLIPLGLIQAALVVPVLPRLIAVAAIWAALTLLQRAFQRLRGRRGLGGGDVKLIAASAAWLPVEILPFYVLAASVTALIEALARRANHDHRLAFGVHLAPWLVAMALFA